MHPILQDWRRFLTWMAAWIPVGAILVLVVHLSGRLSYLEATAVMIPAVLYLAFAGRWGAAIFLACWTATMWIGENILRPLLTAHQAEVSTLAIFVGAIGGATAFGILGLVIGPVLLSFVVALVRFAQER